MTKYGIKPSEDRSCIVLTVVGEVKGRNMMKYILEAHAMGGELGIDRYLVDVTEATNTDSVIDQYDFAYSDMKRTEGVNARARVAALVRPGDTSHDFIEVVLHNAGMPLKIFSDPDAALRYLRG